MATNLDAMINRIGFEIVSKGIVNENEINKMLGVLSNDGVYGWWVYTKSKLDWKFTNDENKFKETKLVRFLLAFEQLNSLFKNYGEIISSKKIQEICQLQNEIDYLQKEIINLNEEIKKLKKENKNNEKKIKEEEVNLKKKEKNEKINERNNKLDNFFHKLSENLSDLLFFREILEKVLIYARYHAKAMGEVNE